MRPDQTARLDELAHELMDVFLAEADPREWSGAGQPATQRDPKVRGDRNWDLKNANQVGALLSRTLDLRERLTGEGNAGRKWSEDDPAEAEIARHERAAREILARVGQR